MELEQNGHPPHERILRIALLASSNLDMLPPLLKEGLAEVGLGAEFYVGGFGQYRQELLKPDSGYYAFKPDVTLLFWDALDIFSPLVEKPLDYAAGVAESQGTVIAEECTDLISLALKRVPNQVVLINDLAAPAVTSLGLLEGNGPWSVSAQIEQFNAILRAKVKEHSPKAALVDYTGLVARSGQDQWYDQRFWYLARCRLGRPALNALAHLYVRYIKATFGKRKKVLVLDLDNTLWGGIVGEDGPEGIRLGTEGIGLAYRDMQGHILNLWRQGVLLAVNSKNNQADAMEVLGKHPYMVLRPDYFSSLQINWRDKATNMVAIADELDLGLDSFVFLDDNPVEREFIKQQLPQVLILDFPDDPSQLPAMLLDVEAFDAIRLTQEDEKRGEMYQSQSKRKRLERSAGSLEEFYRSLEMHASILPVDSFSLPRAAQMTQRTNQFNVTTRRYSEADIASFISNPAWRVYALGLEDRFGDNGLVALAAIEASGDAWRIDTFLMSCRVLGRTVETAFFGFLAREARTAGARYLQGKFIPTTKNDLVKDLFKQHGFEDQGSDHWVLSLKERDIAIPDWVVVN
ncbi:MAG: putative enzyme involved in methoxymalonyl-ACP biosynthesis [Chloroflexi bacterium]|jgi:FkbH-like protein|nr:MAG: putative enzyme involved in methoxymalonyl-ACP biosynthesis [Chloroflexota bacterium]